MEYAMSWSDWREINQPAGYEDCAVYRIRLASAKGAASINRFLGTDTQGLLWIGEAIDFDRRRQRFVRGVKHGKVHAGAKLLHRLENVTSLKAIYPGYAYQYSFRKIGSKEEAKSCEERLIKTYVKQFGEAPPLNSIIPKRDEEEGW